MLFQGVWGNRWWVRCRVVPYMGMEFGGFCKKKESFGVWREGRKGGGTFASVIFTVSGKSIPIATTKTVTIACIYQKVTRGLSSGS